MNILPRGVAQVGNHTNAEPPGSTSANKNQLSSFAKVSGVKLGELGCVKLGHARPKYSWKRVERMTSKERPSLIAKTISRPRRCWTNCS